MDQDLDDLHLLLDFMRLRLVILHDLHFRIKYRPRHHHLVHPPHLLPVVLEEDR